MNLPICVRQSFNLQHWKVAHASLPFLKWGRACLGWGRCVLVPEPPEPEQIA